MNDTLTIGSYRIAVVRLAAFGVSGVVLAALYLVLHRTRLGRAIRATVQNPTSARLLGVDAERVSAYGFGISVATATAAGAVFGMVEPFNPGSHYDLISRLLTIIVLGGLGSLSGAVVAALVMGVSEAVLAADDLAHLVVDGVLRHPDRGARRAPAGAVRRDRARTPVRPLTRLGLARGFGFTAVFLAFPFVFTEPWVVNIAIFTVMYAALATAWNLLGGFSGYLSLGHAAFFGIGAYGEAIVFQHIGIGGGYRPFAVLPAVGFGVAVVALPFAWVALRTRAATFAIVTISMLFIVQQLAFNLHSLTNGAQGLVDAAAAVPQLHLRAAVLPRDGGRVRARRPDLRGTSPRASSA